ncbi:MAG: TonB-dependent receptor [Gammaproteobacteria bacterium]|nr:TonB-dependent receptor [Gammaproteobacteria bacterium]
MIANKLALRVSAVLNKQDGTTRNRVTDDMVNDADNWAARAILVYQPDEDLDITLNVNGGQNRADARHFQQRGMLPVAVEFADASGLCAPAYFNTSNCTDAFGYVDTDGDPHSGDYNLNGKEPVDVFGTSGTIGWDLSSVSLTSITAYNDTSRETLEDTDSGPTSLVHGFYGADYQQYSQELRLASRNDGKLSWIVGGYYYRDRVDDDSYFDLLREIRPLFMSPDNPSGLSPENYVMLARYQYRQKVRTGAVFGQFDYSVADALTLHLGLRQTDEQRSIDYSTALDESVLDGIDFAVPTDPRFPYFDSMKASDVSGNIGLDYQIHDEMLAYVKVSKGVKSGGYGGGLAFQVEEIEPFDDEQLIDYEAGLKSELFERRVRLNLAAFYYDYSDLQVFTLVNRGGVPVQALTNASDARVYGMEAELQARPMSGLDVSLGLGVLRSEYRNFIAESGQDYSGNSLPAAPELSFNGAAVYEWPVEGIGSFFVGSDFSYQSKNLS